MHDTNGTRSPQLKANHPDVLKNVLSTVVHEVGHTLGLRHNFIAQEDGNTSAMCYSDDLDTTSYFSATANNNTNSSIGVSEAKYGGHFVCQPGKYDMYAIKYGYTPLKNETSHTRHPSLDVLANGQHHDATLNALLPLNPLFATDEDIRGEDPRVNTWNHNVRGCGYDKLNYSLLLRQSLLKLVQNDKIYPEMYSERVRLSLSCYTRHVSDCLKLIGGREQDVTRRKMVMTSSKDTKKAIGAVVDFCVGDAFRFNEEEIDYMMSRWPSSSYHLATSTPTENHGKLCQRLLDSVLHSSTLTRLEVQYNLCTRTNKNTSKNQQRLRTFDVFYALAYDDAVQVDGGLFHPFQTATSMDSTTSKDAFIEQVNQSGTDFLRCTASMHLAIVANKRMHSTAIHASVRAGAAAFASEASTVVRTWLDMYGSALDSIAKAHWSSIVNALIKPPESTNQSGGLGNFMRFMVGGSGSSSSGSSGSSGSGSTAHAMNATGSQWLEEETSLDTFLHLGCNRMRCWHDPFRTTKTRQVRNLEQHRTALLYELKHTMLMGNL